MSSERVRHGGFTLIEMMITVALVGIVAAIAYPSYLSSVQKSHRTDAKAALTEAAQRLERYYTENNTYVGAKFCSSGAGCTAAAKVYDERSENGHYALTLPAASLTATGYVAVATPQGGQADDACGSFTVDQAGTRGTSGASPDRCW